MIEETNDQENTNGAKNRLCRLIGNGAMIAGAKLGVYTTLIGFGNEIYDAFAFGAATMSIPMGFIITRFFPREGDDPTNEGLPSLSMKDSHPYMYAEYKLESNRQY